MANASIDLVSLDIPSLEASLKAYMRSQSQFKDYDFDGSNMAALIRLLALNTHKNSFYLNMIHAEGFLDSALTRGSVISHAKELNYTPRSARSAEATINVSFTASNSSFVIEKGKTFSTIIRNRGLVFSVPETKTVTSTNGYFEFQTVLYEGRYVSDSYIVNRHDETQRFILTNPSIDTRSLTVVVYEDGASQGATYTRSSTLLDLDDTSNVYFLQASELGQYEVIFGDSVIGHQPADGATVIFDYRVTVGEDGNGAKVFNRDFEIGPGVSNVRVSTVSNSENGSAAESIESIKYYAPRHFQVQERAVIAGDYSVLLKTQFPEIRAVSSYGGEEANPPRYGKVIIAVDVTDVDGIPQSKRDEYYEFLKRRSGLTMEPIFVEPNFTYASITADVDYNLNVTTLTPDNILTIVHDQIMDFANTYLNDFQKTLRYSRLTTEIDGSHPSIVGNETQVQVYKKVELERNEFQSFNLDFGMSLFDGYPEADSSFPVGDLRTIRSGPFSVSGETRYVTDNGSGQLWVVTDRGSTTVMLQQVGSVDYASGKVQVSNMYVENYDGAEVKFWARPSGLDVVTKHDTILAVEADEVRVSVTAVRE